MLRLAFARAVQRVSAQRGHHARASKESSKEEAQSTSAHRIAMLRNMVTSLIKHERIRTTTPKAKTLGRTPSASSPTPKSDQRHGMNLAARIVREQGVLRCSRSSGSHATRNGYTLQH